MGDGTARLAFLSVGVPKAPYHVAETSIHVRTATRSISCNTPECESWTVCMPNDSARMRHLGAACWTFSGGCPNNAQVCLGTALRVWSARDDNARRLCVCTTSAHLAGLSVGVSEQCPSMSG